MAPSTSAVILGGGPLSLADLARLARDPRVEIEIDPEALRRVGRCARLVRQIERDYREAFAAWKEYERGGDAPDRSLLQDYGVTTGFGEFKDKAIHPDELQALQENILLSHATGVGENADPYDPVNYYPAAVVRAALVIRLNAFLQGHSGVSLELVEVVRRMIVRGVVPLVPLKGSVGSSGDLCPLAHLFVVLVGGGGYSVARRPEDLDTTTRRTLLQLAERDGAGEAPPWEALDEASRKARRAALAADLGRRQLPRLRTKEGLALTNGATFSAAMLALAVVRAEDLAQAGDVAAALSLEAVCGCARAFDPKVHAARAMAGQIDSAANLRALLAGSRLIERRSEVQDPYSLRCAPAVHGASRDAIAHARAVVWREINAATDNPLFFPGEGGELHAGEPWDLAFRDNWAHRPPPLGAERYDGSRRASYSAGNFHGQPVALAADFLAVALAELADVSERRTQMLLDEDHNRGLPANLIPRAGVNSGFMLAQYTAAALVSENKVLAHPASVDSIPTSANSEDHVAMATTAARKLGTVVGNTESVLAIELMVAAQAVEWRARRLEQERQAAAEGAAGGSGGTAVEGGGGAGHRDGEGAPQQQRAVFRAQLAAWKREEAEAAAFAALDSDEARQRIARDLLAPGTGAAYLAVRTAARPMTEDRPLDGDIRRLRRALADRSLLRAVERALGRPLEAVRPVDAAAPPRRGGPG